MLVRHVLLPRLQNSLDLFPAANPLLSLFIDYGGDALNHPLPSVRQGYKPQSWDCIPASQTNSR